MPELPDLTIYLEQLAPRIVGRPLERVRLAHPFLLRSVTPGVREVEGRRATGPWAASTASKSASVPISCAVRKACSTRERHRERGSPGKRTMPRSRACCASASGEQTAMFPCARASFSHASTRAQKASAASASRRASLPASQKGTLLTIDK